MRGTDTARRRRGAARIAAAVGRAEQICGRRGLRFTALRRKLLQLVLSSDGPAKAYDMLDLLAKSHPHAKPPTVYRALAFLQENGFVHKLHSLNAYVSCSHPGEHAECHFLICAKCGVAEECCDIALRRALTGAANSRQFRLRRATVEMEGDCSRCGAATP